MAGAGQDRGAPQDPPHDDPVPVLVVDDQASFRSVMREVVAATPGFEVVAEADSGETALEAVRDLERGLVIMDKRMPGMGGLAACRAIAERHTDVVVLLCSVEDPHPQVARESGARRMVSKQDLSPRVLEAVWRGEVV